MFSESSKNVWYFRFHSWPTRTSSQALLLFAITTVLNEALRYKITKTGNAYLGRTFIEYHDERVKILQPVAWEGQPANSLRLHLYGRVIQKNVDPHSSSSKSSGGHSCGREVCHKKSNCHRKKKRLNMCGFSKAWCIQWHPSDTRNISRSTCFEITFSPWALNEANTWDEPGNFNGCGHDLVWISYNFAAPVISSQKMFSRKPLALMSSVLVFK